MRSISRPLKLTLAVAVGLVMSVALGASATSAAPSATVQAPTSEATWDLSDGEQRLCVPAGHSYTSYFVGFVAGHWTEPLIPEVHGLPEGTDASLTPSVPPGDNGDRYVGVVWLLVKLPPLDYGEYPATLVVTDGTSTQTMPILIKAQDEWGC